jgi:hypothetical protein
MWLELPALARQLSEEAHWSQISSRLARALTKHFVLGYCTYMSYIDDDHENSQCPSGQS